MRTVIYPIAVMFTLLEVAALFATCWRLLVVLFAVLRFILEHNIAFSSSNGRKWNHESLAIFLQNISFVNNDFCLFFTF